MSGDPVGYGKPPAHTRYRRGQSGNPGGRKRGSRNLKTIMEEVMESAVELSDKGRKRNVPLAEALLLQYAQCGLKGDWRAIDSLLERYERCRGDQAEPTTDLAEEDERMMDELLARLARRPVKFPGGGET
jgi:hypothetical protein